VLAEQRYTHVLVPQHQLQMAHMLHRQQRKERDREKERQERDDEARKSQRQTQQMAGQVEEMRQEIAELKALLLQGIAGKPPISAPVQTGNLQPATSRI
jgi:predicted RNase H-like nuclease (RuvC/YqgF family)